jgi:hypothetical protein
MSLSDKIRARFRPLETSALSSSSLTDKLNQRRLKKVNIQEDETARICRLPLIEPLKEAEREQLNYQWVDARAYEEGFRLFPVQVDAIHSFIKYGGLFAPISVGGGKTLITLKIADWVFHNGLERSLLIVPSQVYEQLVKADIPMARWNMSLSVPFFFLGGKSKQRRKNIVLGRRAGCYIMPYSYLSTTDTTFLLNTIAPELLICDEAHRIKNRRAARTRRLMAYIMEKRPLIVALSGTITSKSLMDYQHLLRYALDENSPVPRIQAIAQDWANILDSNAQPGDNQLRILRPLHTWAKTNFPSEPFPQTVSGYRKAFRNRLHTAPGVVASFESGIGTSLIFHNSPADMPGEKLKTLMETVEQTWKTPNGDEIDHAIHKFKWLYELSVGFYNQLIWPTPENLAERRQISISEAEVLLERALEHHMAAQEYAIALREYLKHPNPQIDTPMLVGREIATNGGRRVGRELAELWKHMKNLDFENRPERDSSQVRVDDFKIKAMIKWVQSIDQGGLIWVYHQEMGKWAIEALREAGIEVLYAPAGAHGNRVILNPKNASKLIVASMTAHGEGKNLQAFQNQYFLQWPRSAKLAEQVLGRTHRRGQQADTLIIEMNRTLPFDHIVMAACLTDSLYIHQTTGNRQKLIFGTYTPMPKIYSPEFLNEHGAQSQELDFAARQRIQQRFGKFQDLS